MHAFIVFNFFRTQFNNENSKDDVLGKNISYYEPFENRTVEKPTSTAGTLIHLLKSSLGSGVLAMPMAFRNSGYTFGVFATVAVGIMCTHCVQILVSP